MEHCVNIDDMVIRVHRTWSGCTTAEVRLTDLQELHWVQPAGAPRPLLHGYVSCDILLSGALPHECTRPDAPHRLLVCVLKKHNVPAAYTELLRGASTNRVPGAMRRFPDRYAMMPFRTA
jgi:hypothetical protein